MNFESKIDKRLSKAKAIFDFKKINSININQKYVNKYYAVSRIFYSFFYNSEFLHMGISRDGRNRRDDLLESVRVVEKYIKILKNAYVLELAMGRGANLFYLAKKYPALEFYGIDFSKDQLNYAFRKQKKANNYHPAFGNYHNLSKFKSNSFDLVFVIESFCYSINKDKVFKEVRRILKKGGIFIVVDGYLNSLNTSQNEKIALKLAAAGMALKQFDYYKVFLNMAKNAKFKVIFEEDVTKCVLPTLKWFEFLAKCFFYYAWLGKLISKIFPLEFIYNALSGYFLAELTRKRIACYMITVLRNRILTN